MRPPSVPPPTKSRQTSLSKNVRFHTRRFHEHGRRLLYHEGNTRPRRPLYADDETSSSSWTAPLARVRCSSAPTVPCSSRRTWPCSVRLGPGLVIGRGRLLPFPAELANPEGWRAEYSGRL